MSGEEENPCLFQVRATLGAGVHRGRPTKPLARRHGTRQDGSIAPHNYKMPRAFFNYLNSKARQQAELWASVSSRQAEKIDQSLRDNVRDCIGSDEFRAMQCDIEMFGNDAFPPRKSKSDDRG